jgi:hypothetical protein
VVEKVAESVVPIVRDAFELMLEPPRALKETDPDPIDRVPVPGEVLGVVPLMEVGVPLEGLCVPFVSSKV